MATIVLSAVGASIGGSIGGTMLGLSGAVIGRAVGATVGRAIDQRLLGGGSRAVETGRIDRLRLQAAGEGAPVTKIWGQMRLPGHVIWASPLEEISSTEGAGGGKGAPSQPSVTRISYRLSVAIALCEGPVLGVGRVWADGEEIPAIDLNMRVYEGDDRQMPDPAIVAHEGESAPSYRGIAYVVLENLNLERWGNRMPQLSFEVTCPARDGTGLHRDVRAVALIPGTGEYSLATTQVTQDLGLGETRSINVNTPMGGTDFSASMDCLARELPRVKSVALVVSWFGGDLRIDQCRLRPKVDQARMDGSEMPWRAGGIGRAEAQEVATIDGRPIYGGTPSDQSVIQALKALNERGQKAVFYPFILMEQLSDNDLPDPYGGIGQPVMPWRGRITTSVAAGRANSPDGTAQAVTQVRAFFGDAEASDFTSDGTIVRYHGPAEWSYRRFILHYAHLCAAAGGIDSFLIGSEMIGMTQIRGAQNSYPAVSELRRLAADVREILGSEVKLGYAADWSEYFGHHPGNGELFFHLDPLWADGNIDFIGIDNYMPLSDWRDGEEHLDAHWGDVRNIDYLTSNVCGGEGFDWYYASEADRDAQHRTPITDGAYDEAWVWKYKDLKSWWQNLHFDRPNGVRSREATGWVPGSKPIWFTEYGCAALDKATNQPNKFLDAHSSESVLPYYSSGLRDDATQAAYVEAVTSYWSDPNNNPEMEDGGRMVDMARAHVWCWDARPYPAFPTRRDLWSDGPAWTRGHWLNGRAGAVKLSAVVGDICRDAGVSSFDTSRIHGVVRGFSMSGGETGRAALQPLMLAHGFDAVDRDGTLLFMPRNGLASHDLSTADMAATDEVAALETTRAAEPELAGRLRLTHVEAGADYAAATTEASLPESDQETVSDSEVAMSLTRAEGRAIAERWLAESVVARDGARFALPPSLAFLGAGDVVRIHDSGGQPALWRLDRVERTGALNVDAVRVEPGVYRPALSNEDEASIRRYSPPVPVWPMFLDLPLMRGNEDPYSPHLAATANPWPGSVAAFMSVEEDGGYEFALRLDQAAAIGRTQNALAEARPGVVDRGDALEIALKGHTLRSATNRSLMAGANAMAIGDGSLENWEIFQFGVAEPAGGNRWLLSHRLRGQAGSESRMPQFWPAGSVVVLLNSAVQQAPLPPSVLGQERFWRIGPALRSLDDDSFRSRTTAARGVALRPYAPCHLRANGGFVTWIRRTRVQGDGWEGFDVPLGEARESYVLRLIQQGETLHEVQVAEPEYRVPAGIWASAIASGAFTIAVAQLSDQFGTGPFVRRTFNADA